MRLWHSSPPCPESTPVAFPPLSSPRLSVRFLTTTPVYAPSFDIPFGKVIRFSSKTQHFPPNRLRPVCSLGDSQALPSLCDGPLPLKPRAASHLRGTHRTFASALQPWSLTPRFPSNCRHIILSSLPRAPKSRKNGALLPSHSVCIHPEPFVSHNICEKAKGVALSFSDFQNV